MKDLFIFLWIILTVVLASGTASHFISSARLDECVNTGYEVYKVAKEQEDHLKLCEETVETCVVIMRQIEEAINE